MLSYDYCILPISFLLLRIFHKYHSSIKTFIFRAIPRQLKMSNDEFNPQDDILASTSAENSDVEDYDDGSDEFQSGLVFCIFLSVSDKYLNLVPTLWMSTYPSPIWKHCRRSISLERRQDTEITREFDVSICHKIAYSIFPI